MSLAITPDLKYYENLLLINLVDMLFASLAGNNQLLSDLLKVPVERN